MDYKDENNWLMLGDCLERMKEIPSGSIEMDEKYFEIAKKRILES